MLSDAVGIPDKPTYGGQVSEKSFQSGVRVMTDIDTFSECGSLAIHRHSGRAWDERTDRVPVGSADRGPVEWLDDLVGNDGAG